MAVNLCVAHKKTVLHAAHEVLLVCFLQSCSTRRWISCSAQNIARMLMHEVNSRVTCEFGPSHLTKIEEHMSIASRKCQHRRQLYVSILHPYQRPSTCLHVIATQNSQIAVHDILLTVTLEIVLLCASTGESYSHQFS